MVKLTVGPVCLNFRSGGTMFRLIVSVVPTSLVALVVALARLTPAPIEFSRYGVCCFLLLFVTRNVVARVVILTGLFSVALALRYLIQFMALGL